jgi:osmoprotectant transport system permease protein
VDERWRSALALLPDYLAWHVVLSASALGLGLLVGAPLAITARRRPRLRAASLGAASLIQTIPSLALLALFFPLLLALSRASRMLTGHGFSALGFLPSLLALSLYSLLPILRNGTAALMGVHAGLGEAARSLGLTRRQALWLVELPAAAPVFMGGVRTAAVWVIGAATLSTPVGQTSLGDFIFSGLQTENWVSVVVGCIAAAVLALSTDALLAVIEAGARRADGRRIGLGMAGLVFGVAAAVSPLVLAATDAPAYVIGAKNFSEQYTLADLMADRIEADGGRARLRDDLGSAVAFRALARGEIDAYVDYSGTLWTNVLGRNDTPPRAQMLAELSAELKRRWGVRLLGPLGFENAYALAMRPDRAAALQIQTLSDLSARSPELVMGGDLEIFQRPEWASLERVYDFHFRARRVYQPTFMYRALTSGDVDVISAFSSDGRITADHLVVLADPLHAIPPYDAVILISPRRANDPRLVRALQPLVGAVPIEAMRQANYAVDGRGEAPAQAARELEREITTRSTAARR